MPSGLVYARNRTAGTTELISQSTGGVIANGSQDTPAISGNGRFVAFMSNADNLVSPATTVFHIYVRDRQLGTTERVSMATGGALANASCQSPCLSADGRYVAFTSTATNLIGAGTTAGRQHIYVHDRVADTTELIDVDSADAEAPGHGFDSSISNDGRFVSFTSNADGSAPYLGTGEKIYVRDRTLGITERVSLYPAPGGGDGTSSSISGDGRFVSYTSDSGTQIYGDTNAFPDVFVRDRLAGSVRVCATLSLGNPNNISDSTAISVDGNHVAFTSNASNLTPGDGNGFSDVFVRDLEQEMLPLAPNAVNAFPHASTPQTKVTVTWVDGSANEKNFVVERDSGAGFTPVATLAANSVIYHDPGLTAGILYAYRVIAVNGAGGSDYSNIDVTSTYPLSPDAPTNLTLTVINKTRIDLAWDDNSEYEDGFKIERKIGAGAFTQIATAGANAQTLSATGLTAGTLYSFRVRAFNAPGGVQNSAYSNAPSATTVPNPPPAPTGLAATAPNGTTVNLAWTDNATNETNYYVERKFAGGNYSQIASLGPNAKTYSDLNRTPNSSYAYRVRASNAGGYSSYSNISTVVTLAAPSGLTATPVTSSRIDLNWTDNSNAETGFKIERKQGAGTFAQIATVGAGVTTYQDNTGAAATQYTYRVRANTANSDSTYTNTASAKTLP